MGRGFQGYICSIFQHFLEVKIRRKYQFTSKRTNYNVLFAESLTDIMLM